MVWFLRLFILPHTLIGIFLLTLIPARIYVRYFGTPVTATVDRFEVRMSNKSGEFYWVWYHYMLDGRRYEDTQSRDVPPVVGEAFPGRAVAFAGSGTFHPPTLRAGETLSLLAMAIFWNGVISVFLYMAWVLPIRQRWIARHGIAAPGTITGKRVHGGKGRRYTVSYRFEVWGKNWNGKCDVDSDAYEKTDEGMAVTVLYDPSRPKRSLAYELGDFVVTGTMIPTDLRTRFGSLMRRVHHEATKSTKRVWRRG